jgi:hypothetical protein
MGGKTGNAYTDIAIQTWNGNYGWDVDPNRTGQYTSAGYNRDLAQGMVDWLGQNYRQQINNGQIYNKDYN